MKSIQEISRASDSKALEAVLPSLVIINSKMFSLTPNLQTQEGLVIRMPKPFPCKDSHRVPWKYDATLISTRTGKEKVYFNVFSGLSGFTRSGRRYTPAELRKRRKEIGKGMVELVRNRVTTEEAEEFLKTIWMVDYSVIQ